MCKCWDCGSVCFPDTEATIPSGSHHFPAFLLMSWPSTASPGSRNYSANGVSLNSDICVTKGMWTCQDNCRQRTLRRGEPQGSIFAPLLKVCVSKSPTANFLWRSLKGGVMGCRVELLSCKDASAQSFGKGVSEDSIELLYLKPLN